jgi:hypothetical protein
MDIRFGESVHHDAPYLQVPFPVLTLGCTGRFVVLSCAEHAVSTRLSGYSAGADAT